MSPVLEAYLKSYQQHTDMLQQVNQVVQQQQANQLRKQELQDTMDRFQQTHDLAVKQQQADYEVQKSQINKLGFDTRQAIQHAIFTGELPIPQEYNGPPVADWQQHTTPAKSYSFMNPFTKQQETVEVPPKTEQQLAIETYNKTIGASKEQQYKTQEDINNTKMQVQQAIHEAQNKAMEDRTNAIITGKDAEMARKEDMATLNERAKNMQWMMEHGINPDPKANQDVISRAVQAKITGHMTESFRAAYGNILGQQMEATMNVGGYQEPPKTLLPKINDIATSVIQVLKDSNNFLTNNPAPTNPAGAFGSFLATDIPIINRLTTSGSSYRAYKSETLGKVEKMLGLPLGRISGSPAILKQYEPLIINPTDKPSVIDNKFEMLSDIAAFGISKELNAVTIPTRKILMKEFIDNNPGLKDNGYLWPKIVQIEDTGTYNPIYYGTKVPKID